MEFACPHCKSDLESFIRFLIEEGELDYLIEKRADQFLQQMIDSPEFEDLVWDRAREILAELKESCREPYE